MYSHKPRIYGSQGPPSGYRLSVTTYAASCDARARTRATGASGCRSIATGGRGRSGVRGAVSAVAHSLYGLQYEKRWFMCWLYEPECENRFMHLEHWNGFSPLCSRLCSVRWCLCLNAFGQMSHLCGLWSANTKNHDYYTIYMYI